MSHFAKVLNGKVTQVIVAEPIFFTTFIDPKPGVWIQTSYNTIGGKHTKGGVPMRGNFAGIGYIYDFVNDVFYPPKPYPSWTLNTTTWSWTPPVPMPKDGKTYKWNEATLSWVGLV